jgi:hypothetical protein
MAAGKREKRITLSNSMLEVKHRYAEVWLDNAVELYRPVFAAGGYEIPPVLVSVGFADNGYRSGRKKNAIAICYSREFSEDGVNQIIMTPLRTEPLDLLWLLGHELIHAVDNCVHGHGEVFDEIARMVGYWPHKNATLNDAKRFDGMVESMVEQLGRYPRSPFVF